MSATERGQSLFEILFAFVIMALIVVAIVGLATISIRNSSYSRNKTMAEKYATEAIDWLRQERDTSWNEFAASAAGGKYCLQNLNWDLAGVCDAEVYISNTVLQREVSLGLIDDSNIEAVVSVFWNDSKGLHEIKLNSLFSNWKSSHE